MSSIPPNTTLVTPHYITSNEFRRRLQSAYPSDPSAVLRLALDLRDGRVVVTHASARQAKRIATFVAGTTEAIAAAAARV